MWGCGFGRGWRLYARLAGVEEGEWGVGVGKIGVGVGVGIGEELGWGGVWRGGRGEGMGCNWRGGVEENEVESKVTGFQLVNFKRKIFFIVRTQLWTLQLKQWTCILLSRFK